MTTLPRVNYGHLEEKEATAKLEFYNVGLSFHLMSQTQVSFNNWIHGKRKVRNVGQPISFFWANGPSPNLWEKHYRLKYKMGVEFHLKTNWHQVKLTNWEISCVSRIEADNVEPSNNGSYAMLNQMGIVVYSWFVT